MATSPYRYANSPYSTAEAPSPPGFLREATTAWTLGPINQGLISLEGMGLGLATRDPAYNPWSDMKGYEPYAESLIYAQSRQQMDWMKSQVDFNLREKSMQSGGAYGFAANLIGSLADPINLVPIPISRGLGFVKGAALGATANAGIAAVTDPIRIAADPTADWNELAYSIGGAALFGSALGGVAGRSLPFSKQDFLKGQLHFDRLASDLSDIEGTNIARAFNAAEENYNVVSGATGLFVDARYEPVKIEVVETTFRQKKGPDENLYHYDDSLGWVLEADRGRPDPRPVGQDIQDALGAPERKLENRMVLDEAALKKDFEDGRTGLPDGEVRTAGEYITFKQIEAVWRKREPIQPGETKPAYQARVRESALAELKGSRASASVARTNALATLLDKANFSPVAKALRLFKNDNVLGDLPLQLAGDYGWAIRANEFGYKTPPSLLLRAMRHNVAFNEVRQAVDGAYVRFAQQNSKATGTSFMGHNLTAAAENLKARAQPFTKVVTKEIFARMAGRAVFDQSDFEIDRIRIVPEAREAAKTWARIAQKYDAEARDLGLFYDQQSLQRTMKTAEARMVSLKGQMARRLWGGKGAPSMLYPAVKVGDKMYFGATHNEAIASAVADLGTDVQVRPEDMGYVDNLARSNNAPAETISRPAVRVTAADGETPKLYGGISHMTALSDASDDVGASLERLIDEGKVEDGFITSDGRFVDRKEAAKIYGTDGELSVEEMGRTQPKEQLEPKFRALDDVIKGRIDSLSEQQRAYYKELEYDLAAATVSRDSAKAALDAKVENPHRFLDQYGNPEPFFARFWNHTAIADQRERFRILLTAWYRRDNPIGAEQRADKTIDDMLKDGDSEDTRPAQVPGLRHLNQRKLDIPNSFKISDPQLGEITASEFFNTDLEVVAEAYLRGMGHKIEAAKMFGDAGLWEKKQQLREHFREQYFGPAVERGASMEEIQSLLSRREEYMGWIDLIQRGVMGGLKTRDPWAFDNRIARNLKNYQVLTSMGRVLLTSIPEAMRLPMVNGFKTAFGSLWDRALLDYSKIKPNVELSRETGELFDLVRDVHSARVAELNTPDPSGGGWYIEKLLQKTVPGFFKMVGLTHWTVITKDMLMFGAQHKVMQLAKAVDEGNNAFKLGSMGISRRDAKLLASMPTEQHGNLILPAVQNWSGPDGQRARTLLIDAIHGEARRAIVTPSFADRSLLFNGVLARKGKVVAESDLMSLPLQFMSYGIAASQKVLMSGLQGRDQSFFMGALAMMFLGMFSNYLKQPQTATMNKSTGEWLLEGYEASGVGAFWFSDLNQMIERYSRNTVGLRPTLGIDPRFGKTTNVGDYIDAAGPSIGTIYDVGAAFLDPELTASNRAQAIRRAVPYNNVIWWGSITRDLATKSAQPFK